MGTDHGRRSVIVPKEFLDPPDVIVCFQQARSNETAEGTVYAVTHRISFHNYSSKRYAVNYCLL
jgi:hypothetical protein